MFLALPPWFAARARRRIALPQRKPDGVIRTAQRAALAAIALCAIACLTPGQLGRLSFRFRDDTSLFGATSVRSSLAVGSVVELHVYKSGNRIVGAHGALPDERKTDSSRSIVEARSSAPTVATVEVVDGSEIRVLGLSPGRTDISVRVSGDLNTESLTDIITIDVASVAKVEIAHWLHEPKRGQLGKLSERWLGPDAVYLVGGEARFWIHAFDERDATLLGFGATPPVMVVPEGSATLNWTAQDLHHVSLRFHQPGAIDLLAKGSPTSRLTAVEPSEIEAISVQTVSPSALVAAENTRTQVESVPLRAGDTGVSVITARLKGGKAATLLAASPQVSSKTPAVCEPESPSTDARTQQVFGDSFVAVKLLSEGACRIEVQAVGHSIEHNFEVQPKH